MSADVLPSERPWLALDTATSLGSVAIGWPDRLLGEVTLGVEVRHSEALLPAVDFLLSRTGVQRRDLGLVIVGAGPGSFTGVRIAAATAKGLVHALRIPMLSYSSLAVLAAGAFHAARPVCALFDAKRNEVYAACYGFSAATRELLTHLPPSALGIDDVIERVQRLDPVYVGEGALRHAQRIRAVGGTVAPAPLALPRASSLIWLANQSPDTGRVANPAAWEPEYVRPPGAERVTR
jgi:tRNA threonylcarbamoyladenosine biosynthesis protein TsaB